MKRILAACLRQTVRFQLKDDLEHEAAVEAVKEEVGRYKMQLERTGTKFKLDEERIQPDGSIVLKIRKQYTGYPTGNYLE